MGHYEDFFWEITEELNQLGLRKEFDITSRETIERFFGSIQKLIEIIKKNNMNIDSI